VLRRAGVPTPLPAPGLVRVIVAALLRLIRPIVSLYRRIPLHYRILLSMVIGVAIGLPLNVLAADGTIDPAIARDAATLGTEVGRIFLRLLQMIVVPLVFSSLVTGVMGLGDPRKLGRLGGRTVAYYLVTSLLAILTGLLLVNLIRPGVGAAREGIAGGATAIPDAVREGETDVLAVLWNQVTGMIPQNPFAATAEGDMLPIIFFALVFGSFAAIVGGEHAAVIKRFFEAIFAVMMRITMAVLELAPIGVLGFVLAASAGAGLDAFVSLAWYSLTVASGLVIHACITLPLIVLLLARRSPLELARAVSPALLTAFSTASSNATLPLTLETVEKNAKVPHRVGSFVLPLGATINMDGTALYEAVAVLFIAQAYGADLTLGQQAVVALTALLVSIGAAGIPHAGTVMMVVVLTAVGLPTEAVGLILAVDRVLDMMRTTVNVWSDCTAAAVVAHWDHDTEAPAEPAPAS
jgi:proton glutamate symport protein